MSLYNLIHGMNAELVILLAPFLPRRPDQFPRFRNIFTNADDSPVGGDIYVYTRMGGGNRECCCDDEDDSCGACVANLIESDPQCKARYDDDFDCTYCTFVFAVSEDMKADYTALTVTGDVSLLSAEYKTKLRAMFPNDPASPKLSLIVGAVCGDISEEQRAELAALVAVKA